MLLTSRTVPYTLSVFSSQTQLQQQKGIHRALKDDKSIKKQQ